MKRPLILLLALVPILVQGDKIIPPEKENAFFDCINRCAWSCNSRFLRYDLGVKCSQRCESECGRFAEDVKFTLDDTKENICTNGKSPKSMSKKEYLAEFAKGPCSPMTLIPGVLATRLKVEIDCPKLQELQPETFKVCGWNACKKDPNEFWLDVPNTEYYLWVPDYTSPMTVFSITEMPNLCFANLIKPFVDLSKPIEEIHQPAPGVKISLDGFSKQSKPTEDCGASAISNLLNFPFQTRSTAGFGPMIKAMERAGYISGLTYQAFPYSFSLTYRRNEVQFNFKSSVERLRKFTGKKVAIIAHSFGNVNALYALSKFSQEEKDRNVHTFVSMMAPFLGSTKSNKSTVSGLENLAKFFGRIGLHFRASVKIMASMISNFELMVTEPFEAFKDEPFLEEVKRRMKYEEAFPSIPFSDSGIPYWPPFGEVCHEKGITDIPTNCHLGVFDSSKQPIFIVDDKEFYTKDMQEFLNNYKINESVPQYFEKLHSNNIMNLEPGVPVVSVFMSSISMDVAWQYTGNMDEWYKNSQFPPNTPLHFAPGDLSVSTLSMIMLPLKWAHKFDSSEKVGAPASAHPVKFVEYCSLARQTEPIYDSQAEGQPHKFTKNAYKGLPCDCMESGKSTYQSCFHPNILSDSNLLDLIFEVIIANQQVTPEDMKVIQALEESELEDAVACKHYRTDLFAPF